MDDILVRNLQKILLVWYLEVMNGPDIWRRYFSLCVSVCVCACSFTEMKTEVDHYYIP